MSCIRNCTYKSMGFHRVECPEVGQHLTDEQSFRYFVERQPKTFCQRMLLQALIILTTETYPTKALDEVWDLLKENMNELEKELGKRT